MGGGVERERVGGERESYLIIVIKVKPAWAALMGPP